MNDARPIDATALLNHISVFQRENEDDWDYYQHMKAFIRKEPTIQPVPARQVQMKYSGFCHYCPDCQTMVFDSNADQFCRRCGAKFSRGNEND